MLRARSQTSHAMEVMGYIAIAHELSSALQALLSSPKFIIFVLLDR
jgi:hypothetical protein